MEESNQILTMTKSIHNLDYNLLFYIGSKSIEYKISNIFKKPYPLPTLNGGACLLRLLLSYFYV